jgi:hypothetical protein
MTGIVNTLVGTFYCKINLQNSESLLSCPLMNFHYNQNIVNFQFTKENIKIKIFRTKSLHAVVVKVGLSPSGVTRQFKNKC